MYVLIKVKVGHMGVNVTNPLVAGFNGFNPSMLHTQLVYGMSCQNVSTKSNMAMETVGKSSNYMEHLDRSKL